MTAKTYRILSLTGGGARGIFQAAYIERLSQHFPGPIYKHFDLICGTSTGALIAAAIAVGVEPKEITRAYRELAPKIFNARFAAVLRAGGRYDPRPLLKAIRGILGDKKLCDAEVDLLITATPLDDFGHKVFSTLEGRHTPDCTQTTLADIVAASASAPTYFPPTRPTGSERAYVDGGLWANSPAMIGVLSAHRQRSIPFANMRLLTVGNGKLPQGTTEARFSSLRTLSPSTIGSVLELLFSSQESLSDATVSQLLGPANVLIANAALDENIALDDAKTALARLPSLAEKAADQTKDQFSEHFSAATTFAIPGQLTQRRDSPAAPYLVSRDLVRLAGLTGFYPSRKYYGSHRRDAESISTYIATAAVSIEMVSVNLMTGLPYEDLVRVFRAKLLGSQPGSFNILVSLLDPRESHLMESFSPILGIKPSELSGVILQSLQRLGTFSRSLPEAHRQAFDIRVHKSIPFGSAIMLDRVNINGRIQIETKPYKVGTQRSFAFEVMRTDEDGLFEALAEGYENLLQDGGAWPSTNLAP